MKRIDVHVHPLFPNHTIEEIEKILLGEMGAAKIDLCVLLAIDILPNQLKTVLLSRNYAERFQAAFKHEMDWRVKLGNDHSASDDPSFKEETLDGYIDKNQALLMRIATITNEKVSWLCSKHPEKFIGFGSINPARNTKQIREKFCYFLKCGFKGIKLLPTIQFFNPEEKRLNLIYDFIRENNMTLLIHTGCDPLAWQFPQLSEDANPKYLAKVAKDFPEMKIIAAHLGSYSYYYPGVWLDDMIQLMKEHKNVYADISALTHRSLFGSRNYLKKVIEKIGSERILFGSDFPAVFSYSMADAARTIDESDLDEKTKDRIMGENAEKILTK